MIEPEKWLIWGTGSLCDRFLDSLGPDDIENVFGFIDSSVTGTKSGLPIDNPQDYHYDPDHKLFICSSWLNDIASRCQKIGVPSHAIMVVQPRSLDVIPLDEFEFLGEGQYYFLPWKHQMDTLGLSLSTDIVYPDVYKTLTQSVGYCFVSPVKGDFAEFGTCSGYTASLLSHAIEFYSKRNARHEQAHQIEPRELCLFDSFQGFPEATLPEDTESPQLVSGVWGTGTAKGLSAQELYSLCSKYIDSDRLKLFEGWYKDTLLTIEPERKFALVHMDCDLYESTLDVLNHLMVHKHLSGGAILIFDNWFCNQASPEYGEMKAWREISTKFNVVATDLGMYGCVGNRFIVHHYG